jgi:dsDNA-specific endonuclease/ATPase MutS2
MKTLGLASLMSKAGMFLPAKNRPSLPWFNLVLADIGDNQVIVTLFVGEKFSVLLVVPV